MSNWARLYRCVAGDYLWNTLCCRFYLLLILLHWLQEKQAIDPRQLISQLASGDPVAPKVFLNQYGGYIRAVLRRRFSVSDVVHDDLFQTVTVHLFNNNWQVLQQWGGDSRLETYLATVTINKGTDYIRTKRNNPLGGGDEIEVIDYADATGYALDAQIKDLVHRVLAMLPRKYSDCRKLLKLKYLHDFSYAEIAEIMERTTNQVGVYLKRCLDRCRALLGYDNPLRDD